MPNRNALLTALLVAIAAPVAASGPESVERLFLDELHPGSRGERVVDLYVRAQDANGEPVDGLGPRDLEIRQDGERLDPDEAAVRITSLDEAGSGVACVLALDISRTMMGGAFARARRAAVAFLDRLGPQDRLAVVTFAQGVEVVSRFEAPPAEVRATLAGLEVDPSGLSTRLYDGLDAALDLLAEGRDLPRRRLLVVFSDGKDSGSERELAGVVERARSQGVSVHAIGYARFGGAGLDALRRLARETGATFEPLRSDEGLAAFFAAIRERAARSYVVRFEAPMDGARHAVELAIGGARDAREARYPEIAAPGPLAWPWWAAAVGLLLAGVAWAAVRRFRSAGRLVFVDGPRNGEVVPLRGGVMRIGAISSNDIVIPSVTVSGHHAELRVRALRVELTDLRSEHGTRLNGNPLAAGPAPVTPGDRIQIADVDMVFER